MRRKQKELGRARNGGALRRPLLVLLLLGVMALSTLVTAEGLKVDERFAQAEQALNQGDLAAGRSHLEAILKENPNDPHAANLLGNIALAQGELDKAKAYYNQALNADPLFAESHNNLGVLALKRGELDVAMVHFHSAVRIDPMRADAWFNMGQILIAAGENAKAADYLRHAVQADGSHVGARHRLAVLLLDMGRVEEAVALLEEAVKIAPQRGELQFLLAAMLDEQGQTDKALQHYRLAREAGYDTPELTLYTAEALARTNQRRLARDALLPLLDATTEPEVRQRAQRLMQELSDDKPQ